MGFLGFLGFFGGLGSFWEERVNQAVNTLTLYYNSY
jgi:hypothetical protein